MLPAYPHVLSGGGEQAEAGNKIVVEPFTEGVTKPIALHAEETKEVELILGNPDKIVKIGTNLGEPL